MTAAAAGRAAVRRGAAMAVAVASLEDDAALAADIWRKLLLFTKLESKNKHTEASM